MMAAVLVNLFVVNLICKIFLKEVIIVYVVEVYMGGLFVLIDFKDD